MKKKSGIDMSVFELADRLDIRNKSLTSTEMLEKTMEAIDKMIESNITITTSMSSTFPRPIL